MTNRFACLVLAATGLLLGGCTHYGAWNSPGMWQPTRSNDANLRAMVADPHDLVVGRGSTASPGDEAARAVTNFETGKSPALPSSSSSGGAGGGSSVGSTGSGSTGAGVSTGP